MNIIMIILCSLLWALGGFKWKWCKRYILPISISLYKWNILGLLSILPFSLGYGVPCWNDKGSMIGRFFYALAKKQETDELKIETLANLYTKIFMGFLYGSFIYIVTRNIYSIVLLTLAVPYFGAIMKKKIQFKIGNIILNSEDILIGGIMGVATII